MYQASSGSVLLHFSHLSQGREGALSDGNQRVRCAVTTHVVKKTVLERLGANADLIPRHSSLTTMHLRDGCRSRGDTILLVMSG